MQDLISDRSVELKNQLRPICAKPLLCPLCVRTKTLDRQPKSCGMVRNIQMNRLVCDQVAKYEIRCENNLPVERQVLASRTVIPTTTSCRTGISTFRAPIRQQTSASRSIASIWVSSMANDERRSRLNWQKDRTNSFGRISKARVNLSGHRWY